MKKYIRYISIVPVLLLTVFFFWGCSCSEPRVQSISISITESENVTFLGGNRYEVVWDESNPYVEINASIYPTGFSVGDLEWTSSSPSIATFMNKNRGLLTCIRDGSISVTASLQGVSSTIFIEIVSASSTRFPSSSVQSGYTGKIYGKEPVPLRIRENDFINKEEDIAVYIHVPYINDGLHSHDHFEINYVYKGTGYFSFSRNGKERMAAKELLESTNIPISRICEIIGYSSPEHFSRIFKKEYQVSPSDYRKSIDFSCGNEKSFEEP